MPQKIKIFLSIYSILFIFLSCENSSKNPNTLAKSTLAKTTTVDSISLLVLGTVQDAGAPHIGCQKSCCADLFEESSKSHYVVSLGLIDPQAEKSFLIEATPDISYQLRNMNHYTSFTDNDVPDGIFLTHAHIGHYTGLMYLSKEAKGADNVPVYAMPRMKDYLENNGPWSQLVTDQNIALQALEHKNKVTVSDQLALTPFTVPHRDEYSETVGYIIEGPNKKVLFIPDIDKWDRWDTSIEEVLNNVDIAFLDATFYDAEEIGYRDISLIPHPFIIESMERFQHLSRAEKNKIHFIHLNHTNPALKSESEPYQKIIEEGYHVAKQGALFTL